MNGKKSSEFRKNEYKNRGLSSEELRRRREEASVELRKSKREESLNKKRNILEGQGVGIVEETEATAGWRTTMFSKLPSMVQGIYSQELESQLMYAREFRKLLSHENNPPIDEVLQSGVLPRFVEFLCGPSSVADQSVIPQYEKLQFEAAWVITNIASGSSLQTQVVIESGAVPVFISLLSSSSSEVREQAVWALGNIAGDSPACRNFLLSANTVPPLLNLIKNELCSSSAIASKSSMLKNATWTLSNLTRGKPAPPWEAVSMALPILAHLINTTDNEVIADACWGLSYLSDGDSDKISAVISIGVVPRLVQLLLQNNVTVQSPVLRVVGNIVTGDDYQTQAIISANALPALLALLSSPKQSIQKEACWAISNITAGTTDQVQAVIDANLIPPLVSIMSTADYKTRKEACWAISNATSARVTRPEQVRYLVSQGCIKPLCDILATADNKVVKIALDALSNILDVGSIDHVNVYAEYVEEAGGVDKIYDLQSHVNDSIYMKAKDILDRYFIETEESIGMSEGPELGFAFTNENLSVPQGGFQF